MQETIDDLMSLVLELRKENAALRARVAFHRDQYESYPEVAYIHDIVKSFRGNKTAAARHLKMTTETLYQHLREGKV
jgi:DNA-binding NtrC family response regulator